MLLDSLTDDELGTLLRPDAPEEPACVLAVFPSCADPFSTIFFRGIPDGETPEGAGIRIGDLFLEQASACAGKAMTI